MMGKPTVMNLGALLGGRSESDEPEARPDALAQRVELLRRFRAATEETDLEQLKPGALVEAKEGFNILAQRAGKLEFIFWRWLDEENSWQDRLLLKQFRNVIRSSWDCLVAYVDDGVLSFTPVHSSELRVVDPTAALVLLDAPAVD